MSRNTRCMESMLLALLVSRVPETKQSMLLNGHEDKEIWKHFS